MNERIIKIGLESGILNYVDNETPRHYFASVYINEQELEEFAKLIVLECVQVVNAADESCEDYYGPIIKEHFGVEE